MEPERHTVFRPTREGEVPVILVRRDDGAVNLIEPLQQPDCDISRLRERELLAKAYPEDVSALLSIYGEKIRGGRLALTLARR